MWWVGSGVCVKGEWGGGCVVGEGDEGQTKGWAELGLGTRRHTPLEASLGRAGTQVSSLTWELDDILSLVDALERHTRPGVLDDELAGLQRRARKQAEAAVGRRHKCPVGEPIRTRGQHRRRTLGILTREVHRADERGVGRQMRCELHRAAPMRVISTPPAAEQPLARLLAVAEGRGNARYTALEAAAAAFLRAKPLLAMPDAANAAAARGRWCRRTAHRLRKERRELSLVLPTHGHSSVRRELGGRLEIVCAQSDARALGLGSAAAVLLPVALRLRARVVARAAASVPRL